MAKYIAKKLTYKKRTTKRKSRIVKTKSGATTFRSKPMRRAVISIAKQVVQRAAEHKVYVFRSLDDVVPSNNANFLTAVGTKGYIPLSPFSSGLSIQIGTGRFQRIGSRVRTVSLKMKYIIYPMVYNATFNPTPTPIEFLMYIFKSKLNPDITISNATASGGLDFFELGSATEGFTGNLTDLLKLPNTTAYTIHKKVRHKVGTSGYSGTIANANQNYYLNNDFKYNVMRTIDLTKYCPKVVSWADGATAPDTHLVQCLHCGCPADGSKYTDGNGIAVAKIWYELEYTFTDI